MIINNPAAVLRTLEQAMSADLVNKPGSIAGKTKDFINGTIQEDIMISTGISKVFFTYDRVGKGPPEHSSGGASFF